MEALLDIFNQYDRWLRTLANLLLVVLIALILARGVLFVLEELNSQEATIASPVQGQQRSASSRIDITSFDVFGQRQSSAAAPVLADAPATRLNLELQGVFTAADPEESTAIVGERNKMGELYNIGDRLPGNATLRAVFDDHILIDRGGRVEKLMFSDAGIRQQFAATPAPDFATSPMGTSDGSRLQNIRERIAARQQELQLEPAAPVAAQAQRPSPLRERIASYRDRLVDEPEAVLQEIGISPVTENEASGYRLSGEVPAQTLAQVGLQNGDVILSVNGTPVGNVANDQALIDQALGAGRVRVEVQRDDRRFFLTVPIP